MRFLLETVITVAQTVLAFYDFWMVWRVLVPILPGPDDPAERIAPYAKYFTDPFMVPLGRFLRMPERIASAVLLLALAALHVGLTRLGQMW